MKKTLQTLILLSIFYAASGQNDGIKLLDTTTNSKSVINAQKTSNAQDILTNFYKVSLDSILGKTHQFSFNSTFYGLDTILFPKKMAKNKDTTRKYANTDSVKLKRYINWQAFLNHNSLNISLKGDSVNNLTGLSAGLTLTIWDERDLTYTRAKEFYQLTKQLNEGFQPLRKKLVELLNYYNKTKAKDFNSDFSVTNKKLSAFSDSLCKKIINSGKLHFYANSQLPDSTISFSDAEIIILKKAINGVYIQDFKDIGTLYARKPLLTFSPKYTYDLTHKQPTYAFVADLLFSLNPKNIKRTSWETELKATYKILNDTSVKKTNYNNQPLSFSAGVNKVILQNADKESRMELKIFTEYDDYHLGSGNAGSAANKFTFNSTFRVNVYKSLWLPITVSYDPKNGNVFGYVSVTANLSN